MTFCLLPSPTFSYDLESVKEQALSGSVLHQYMLGDMYYYGKASIKKGNAIFILVTIAEIK